MGAATINAIVTFGLLVVGIGIGVVATLPDVAVVELVLGLGAAGIVIPIAIYPMSYTVWQAVDLAMHPPEPGDDAPPPVL